MADPTISIVVPCHAAEATIAETVRSVLAQSFADWELVLVSDDGRSYLEPLAAAGIADPRIREHPERTLRAGHVPARRRGTTIARGAIVADLDADDIWRPTRLAELMPLAARYGAAQDVLECFDADGVLGYSGPCDGAVEALGPAEALAIDFPFHLVARREAVEGLWLDDIAGSPDSLRAGVLAARGALVRLNRPLLRYRVHTDSMTQSTDGDRLVDAAYRSAIAHLRRDDRFGLDRMQRAALIRGFRRKQRLNRAHMAASAGNPAMPPFIAWVLAGAS